MERFNISPSKGYNYSTPEKHGKTPIPPEQFTPRSAGTSKEVGIFKPPPDPDKMNKRRRTKVLSEDEYVEKVGQIIERDFYPELEKLKAQSEYIDASERQDSATMRRLEERYSSRRPTPSTDTLDRLQSPATFETPLEEDRYSEDRDNMGMCSGIGGVSPANSWKSMPSNSSSETTRNDHLLGNCLRKQKASLNQGDKIGLDKFLAVHTSEDNESFSELMEDAQEEFRRTHAWMFKKEEQLSIESKQAQLALPSPESQADQRPEKVSSGSTSVDGWTYKNVNAVFYVPEGAPLTDGEKVELAKKERKVVLENTRFTANPWKSNVQSASVKQAAEAKQNSKLGKVGADGKELVDGNSTPSVGGFKLIRMGSDATPQIDPEESPLMTWGEVESTPYRLEGCETPLLTSGKVVDGGPSFTMQQVPKRDRIGLQLAEKNSKFYRDKKGQAIYKARCNLKTPKSIGNLVSTTPSRRLPTLSPAAQRLASGKLGIRLGTDKSLSAAYNSPAYSNISSRSNRTPILTSSNKSKLMNNVSFCLDIFICFLIWGLSYSLLVLILINYFLLIFTRC